MRIGFIKILVPLLMAIFSGRLTYSQEHNFINKNQGNKIDLQNQNLFNDIEEGIQKNEVNKIAKYFSQQPYLSFSDGITGYYSSNQAYYILEDFLNLHRVITFRFENKKIDDKFGYATGTYIFELKGKRDSKQVYLTLNKIGNNWYITQISIN